MQWATKKSLNYSLLSDPSNQLIKKLGAFVQPNKSVSLVGFTSTELTSSTKRSHFIFSKDDGKLIDLQLGVKPADESAAFLATNWSS